MTRTGFRLGTFGFLWDFRFYDGENIYQALHSVFELVLAGFSWITMENTIFEVSNNKVSSRFPLKSYQSSNVKNYKEATTIATNIDTYDTP